MYYSIVDINQKTKEDKIDSMQKIEGKTKLNFYQNIKNQYVEKIQRRQKGFYQFEEDPFSRNGQTIGKTFQVISIFMKILQIRPRDLSMNLNFYDLCFTVIENLTEDDKIEISDESFRCFCPI